MVLERRSRVHSWKQGKYPAYTVAGEASSGAGIYNYGTLCVNSMGLLIDNDNVFGSGSINRRNNTVMWTNEIYCDKV